MASYTNREGLGFARMLMVLSSASPLFILWAIRGTTGKFISESRFLIVCLILIVVPNAFLVWRVLVARREHDQREIVVGRAEDHRDHLLVYLFAMLLPFYADPLADGRAFAAAITAIAFVVFLFWHLRLHYMNILFAIVGYRVFTIDASAGEENPHGSRSGWVLITKRVNLLPGDKLVGLRVSDTVYLEVESAP